MSKIKKEKTVSKNNNYRNTKNVSQNKQVDFHNPSTNPTRDWFVIGIKNGTRCYFDGEIINDLIPNVAIFHTIGMEQYNHPDFQLVLNCDLGN